MYDLIRDFLAFVGGGGGLVYWWNRWRNRTHLSVTIVEHPDPREGGPIRFEVTNLGDHVAALRREVTATLLDYTGEAAKRWPYGTWRRLWFFLDVTDRSIPPHRPRRFDAYAERDREIPSLYCFVTYTFRPVRGSACRVRVRHVLDEPITGLSFVVQRAWSRISGRFRYRDKGSSLEDWEAMRRRRGVHDRDA